MPYSEEIKLAIIIIAIVAAYVLLVKPRLQKRKQKLLNRFLHIQSLSLNMQDTLLKHVLKYDAMNDEVAPGVTFKTYLRNLQRNHAAHLSDKHYKRLKNQNVVFFSLKINRMLNLQQEKLKLVMRELSHLESFSQIRHPESVNY